MKRFPGWALAALLLTGGCDGPEQLPQAEAERDTAGFGGLTPEQIRDQAEPMRPEVAESLGIVDTTIHLDDPVPRDTAVPPNMTPAPTDTTPIR